jgi:hypothetical protein
MKTAAALLLASFGLAAHADQGKADSVGRGLLAR